MSISSIYLTSVLSRLETYHQLGSSTLERLDTAQLHWQPEGEPNSIATIVKHLHGNMLSRWTDFLTTDGEKPNRNRDVEFEADNASREQILQQWMDGWSCMLSTLRSLQENDLLKTIYIRKEPLTVLDAINRQLAHVPYHVGQIVYLGKVILKDRWESLSIPKGQSAAYNSPKTGNK